MSTPEEEADQGAEHYRLACILSLLGGFANGYNVNTAGTILDNLHNDYQFDDKLDGMVTSSIFVGSAAGCLLGGWLCDVIGRRSTSVLGEILIIIFSQLSLISANPFSISSFRLFVGLGIGICNVAKPMYVAELCPPATRGTAMSFFTLSFSGGILVTFLISLATDSSAMAPGTAWRVQVMLGSIPAAALLGFIALCVPESPVWLRSRDAISTDEQESLNTGRESNPACDEPADEPLARPGQYKSPLSMIGLLVSTTVYRKPLLLSLVMVLMHQWTGITILVVHATYTFSTLAVGNAKGACVVLVGVAHLVGAAGAMAIIDRYKRRWLLFSGLGGLIGITVAFVAVLFAWDAHLAPLAAILVYMFIVTFQVFLGATFWTVTTEMFPNRVRGVGLGLCYLMMHTSAVIVLLLYGLVSGSVGHDDSMSARHGLAATFAFFLSIQVLVALVLYVALPETAGIDLSNVEQLWQDSEPGEEDHNVSKEPPLEEHHSKLAAADPHDPEPA